MFVNIQTFFFNSGRNTQAVNFVEDFEDDVSHQCGPSADDDYTKNLCTEESEATSVECAAFYGKQTGKNGSEATAYTVYGRGTYRVVNFQAVFDEFYSENHDGSADSSDKSGSHW